MTFLREVIFWFNCAKVLLSSSFFPNETWDWKSKWVMLQAYLSCYGLELGANGNLKEWAPIVMPSKMRTRKMVLFI